MKLQELIPPELAEGGLGSREARETTADPLSCYMFRKPDWLVGKEQAREVIFLGTVPTSLLQFSRLELSTGWFAAEDPRVRFCGFLVDPRSHGLWRRRTCWPPGDEHQKPHPASWESAD